MADTTKENGTGGKVQRAAERIELDAVSGLRFFATFFLVAGRAIETMWMDSGTEAEFLNLTLCTGLHIGAKDVVSFYYILSGFTMTWGYISRDFDSHEVRWRYWVRRFARFYPDFAISTVVTFLVKQPWLFGCNSFGLGSWISTGTSLFLFTAWYRFFPGTGYINGPVWFIVTLFWLWVFFPFLLEPVKNSFRTGGWSMFIVKMLVIWAVSLLPWVFISEENVHYVRWGLRCFPLLRIPEFVLGMALALRVNQDKEEEDMDEEGSDKKKTDKEDSEIVPDATTPLNPSSSSSSFHPRLLAPYLPIVGLTLSISYYVYRVRTWPDGCTCLTWHWYECFGRIENFDTKFAPIALAVIYGVTTLDVCARGPDGTSCAAVSSRLGMLASWLWAFFTWPPFVKVGTWGLPIFLYQAMVNVLTQALLVDLHWGIESRCDPTDFTLSYAWFFWLFHIAMAYLVAFLMNNDGPIGYYIHSAVKSITPK
mmetsp:Transcript_39794/g.81474  ORF Transcript_39794/g.81474 Transcript_39794/m.81474 type:complete len:480 (+) Transcript_39794:192-1631(+)|eukprot:CAMPEP_0181316704 /NCGR_PEP_ID=MMETSP1101-20121128/16040_1 /TAXON_ID=46948 /ORGANISM="Rhodomonas abbreviata, Strain Caron Lab Isolate" /LENGTH=479 /DNA_ID=CAMNT_0023423975 /DNA_START=192 /DNA_END=1631 /DNA_ORIENTATION=+